MGTANYGVTAKKVVVDLNGEKIQVRLLTSLDRNPNRSVESLVAQARDRYAQGEKAEYAAITFDGLRERLHGAVVFRLPSDFDGVHRTYDSDDWEVVGTLLHTPDQRPQFRLVTNEMEVEQIRRAREFEAMKAGRLSVGSFQYDVETYQASLALRDAASPSGMATRKHGFS